MNSIIPYFNPHTHLDLEGLGLKQSLNYRKKWPVCTFVLRYRINYPTSIDPAADELRRALQRSRVDALVQVQSRFCQRVEDITADIEPVHPLPQPVPPPSMMCIGSALGSTSLLSSVPTFATTSLPAKPAFATISLPVKLASATTSLVAPQLALAATSRTTHYT
jgi:hypothetical protein